MKYILPMTALCSAVLLTACGDDDAAVNYAATGGISLSGTARVNETLFVVNGYKDRNGIEKIKPSYQWYGNDVAIAAATDASIILTADQLKQDVHVEIDFVDDDGFSESLVSDSVAVFYPHTISLVADRKNTIGITKSEDYGEKWNAATVPMVTSLTERHFSPSIATNSIGNLVVVSVAEDGSEYEIVVSSSDDNGAVWSDIKLLVPTGSVPPGLNTEPEVSTDKKGNWMVVWDSNEDFKGTGTDKDIFYVTSVDNGITWTTPEPINPFATSDNAQDSSPRLSMHESNWVVTWSSEYDSDNSSQSDFEIYTMHSDDNGEIWSTPKKVSKDGVDNTSADISPHLQISETGRGLLIWSGHENGTDSDIYGSRTTDFGKNWTAGAVINTYADTDNNTTTVTYNDVAASVLVNDNGIYVATWYGKSPDTGSDNEAFYAYSVDSGSSWIGMKTLNLQSDTDETEDLYPRFLKKPNGGWLASWIEGTGKVWVVESGNLSTWSTPRELAETSTKNIAWENH